MVAPLFLIVLALAALPSVGPVGAIVAPQPVDASFIPTPTQVPPAAVANAAAADLLVNETRRCAAVSSLAGQGVSLSRKSGPLMATATSKRLTSTVTFTSLIPVPHSSVSLHPPPRHSLIAASSPIATSSVFLTSSAIPVARVEATALNVAGVQTTATLEGCHELLCAIGSVNDTDQLIPPGPSRDISGRSVQPTASVAIIPPKTTVTLIFDGPTIDVTAFAIDAPIATANATIATPVANRPPTATTTQIDDNNIKFHDVVSLATGLFATVLSYWWTAGGMILAFLTFGRGFPFWVVGDIEIKAITDDRPPVVDTGNAVVDRKPIANDGVPLPDIDIAEDVRAIERVIIVDKPPAGGSPSTTSPAALRRSPPARIVCGRRYNRPKPRSVPKMTSATLAKMCSAN